MSIKLSGDLVDAVYTMLDHTEPFVKWNLPPVDDVLFAFTRSTINRGAYYVSTGGIPVIELSRTLNTTLEALIKTMAHEMVHLFEGTIGDRNDVKHSATWHKYADQVCKVHGWDRALF